MKLCGFLTARGGEIKLEMLKFPRSVSHVFISNLLKPTPGRSFRFSRSISSTSWKRFAVGPMDRLFMKPILVEEDSTDDEYDENMNLKKIKSKNKGIGNGGNFLDEDEDQENDSEFDENNQPLPQKRVGREILRLGRVNYRVPEILPDWIMQRKEQISEHRTTKQLRRCIKNWMLKPDREIQKKYAEKEIGWSNTAPREAVKEASRVMSYGPEETVAYVNFFMPSRYVITRRVFNELKELLPKYRPRRIYDFGCGPATCAAAAIDVWGQDTVERYVGVDMSQSMLDAAKIMTTRMGLVIPNSSSTSSSSKKGNGSHDKSGPDIIFTTKSADVIGRIAASKDDSQRFDMAIAAYTLSELTSDSVKRAAVQVLFESLDNNGLLVIIDNGSPIGSHHTRSARQMLLDLFGNKDNLPQSDHHKAQTPTKDIEIKYVLNPTGAPRFTYEDYEISVVAPCTHDGTCPLRPGSWCSFPQRAQSSLIRRQNEEKFSYVVLQKKLKTSALMNHLKDHENLLKNAEDYWLTHVSDPRLVTADPTPLNIVQRFLDYEHRDTNPLAEQLMDEVDFDDYHPPLVRNEYGRILRSPMKKKEHVVMDLCQSDGYLTRTTISKSSAWNIPHFYSAIRKLRWGGIVPALPVSVQDLSAHEEKSHDAQGQDKGNGKSKGKGKGSGETTTEGVTEKGYQPILVMSPLARRRPSTYPPVRRDVLPPQQVEKDLFGHGEGPQGRYERNRDARNGGIELYQLKYNSEGKRDDEDESFERAAYDEMGDGLSGDMNADEAKELNEMYENELEDFEQMTKYSKTIDALRRNEKLIGRELGKVGEDREEQEMSENEEDDDSDDREQLEGYDDSDLDDDDEDLTEEDKKRMISMTDEDWQEWLDILEGKDPSLKSNKKRDFNEEESEFIPSLSDKKRRQPLSLSDSPTSSRARGGQRSGSSSSMNEALLSKLSSRNSSNNNSSSSTVIEKSHSPSKPNATSSGGRKKPTPVTRRTKKTDME